MYFDCRYCAVGEYAADVRLGVAGGQTRQARRLLCLAGTSWSFAMASDHLREMSGLQVAANTVRNVCQAEAGRVEQWQASAPQAAAEYAKSSGEVEFFTDGTCVNTTAGWKEMRLGVFTKRPLGDAATPDEWCDRVLPKPTSRHVFAAIESADAFATRWPLVASRLGIRSQRRIDVVADGARWIWERVRLYWANAVGTLDIYHALEHVAAAGKALHGEGTSETSGWIDHARHTLLREGHAGIKSLLAESRLIAVRGAAAPRAERAGTLPRRSRRAPALRPAAGRGPSHRQRPSGRGLQTLDWPSAEANRRPLADRPGQPHGWALCPEIQQSVGRLLVHRRLTAKIRECARNRCGVDRCARRPV